MSEFIRLPIYGHVVNADFVAQTNQYSQVERDDLKGEKKYFVEIETAENITNILYTCESKEESDKLKETIDNLLLRASMRKYRGKP